MPVRIVGRRGSGLAQTDANMPTHITPAEFTRRFLALVDRLSEEDRATLADGWAGGYVLFSAEQWAGAIAQVRELDRAKRELARALHHRNRPEDPDLTDRDDEIIRRGLAGESVGRILVAMKAQEERAGRVLTRAMVKSVYDRKVKPRLRSR